jgi:hypothetical protein
MVSGPQDLEGKKTSSQGRVLLQQFCWSQSPGNQTFLAWLHKESCTKKFILGKIKIFSRLQKLLYNIYFLINAVSFIAVSWGLYMMSPQHHHCSEHFIMYTV